jgi:hypothetical protein
MNAQGAAEVSIYSVVFTTTQSRVGFEIFQLKGEPKNRSLIALDLQDAGVKMSRELVELKTAVDQG